MSAADDVHTTNPGPRPDPQIRFDSFVAEFVEALQATERYLFDADFHATVYMCAAVAARRERALTEGEGGPLSRATEVMCCRCYGHGQWRFWSGTQRRTEPCPDCAGSGRLWRIGDNNG